MPVDKKSMIRLRETWLQWNANLIFKKNSNLKSRLRSWNNLRPWWKQKRVRRQKEEILILLRHSSNLCKVDWAIRLKEKPKKKLKLQRDHSVDLRGITPCLRPIDLSTSMTTQGSSPRQLVIIRLLPILLGFRFLLSIFFRLGISLVFSYIMYNALVWKILLLPCYFTQQLWSFTVLQIIVVTLS